MLTTPQPYQNFGPLLSYQQAIKSDTAIRKGIDNTPSPAIYANMQRVYQDFYVPICAHFGRLPITSFYRSPKLNAAIGGASKSAHLYGCAIDIDCDGLSTVTNKALFDWVRRNLLFDQLILENPDAHGNPAWVHVAHNRDGQAERNQVMKMVWVKGKQLYEYL
ncbi:D-Ala-D-Ala carboxypeptidase family metallohydrolase [Spirosoma pollinicola]|uniref:Peptidase M15 n=1 Tax=Spirosoma pollinicola TaxID=2057025 RepID=A0A2K8YTN6_9BACT|nr:D-Ala-D-Ala carboxypeptidase family metallohydrolase [Spirosoma pollinicola]AUD00949.1 peptidase M15 [Spirosoma pollinicola]